ncbi:MAG: hypothetical protein EOP26_06535 [Rhodococcus sp. (in: high G+C Gram-positive bacteria)]|nr:MAG: hypothetical protein EOP26_06535 [Rhodococcus sp. (in: high G+C Gram-positive bacteria)]
MSTSVGLAAEDIARVVYPTSPVVLVDDALGLPDLAEKARTLLPETADGRAAAGIAPDSGPGA